MSEAQWVPLIQTLLTILVQLLLQQALGGGEAVHRGNSRHCTESGDSRELFNLTQGLAAGTGSSGS